MTDMGGLEPDHHLAELRQAEPLGHLAAQDAAHLALAAHAFAGDDQHEAAAVGLRPAQEPTERDMRLTLGQAMQVESRIDRLASARQLLFGAAVELGERLLGWRRRRRSNARGC